MRRTVGFLLIAIGVFAIVLGLAMPLYAYPNLARLERGGLMQSVAEGDGMTVFNPESAVDPDVPPERTDVRVIVNRTVKGIADAPEAKPKGDIAVWEIGLVIMDRDNPDPDEPISVVEEKTCVDRRTSQAVQEDCTSDYVKDPGRAEEYQVFNGPHEGQVYKFPFATERKDYTYFDTALREAPTARYVGEEKVQGLTVYKFEQVIPRTRLEEREVPGRLLGQPDQPTIAADRYYENRRTLWVEPDTGVIIKGTEQIRQTLEDPGTGQTLTLLAGTLELNEETVNGNVKRARDGAGKLRMLKVTAPWVLGIGGVVFIAVGAWLAFTRRRGGEHVFRG